MKKQMAVLYALVFCMILLFTACAGKRDTPFSQPVQGAAPAAPSAVQPSAGTDPAPAGTTDPAGPAHPFGSASTAQPSASPDASSAASGAGSASSSAAAPAQSQNTGTSSSSGSQNAGTSSSSGGQNTGTASPSGSQNTSEATSTGSRGATVRADGGLRLRSAAGTDGESLLTIPDGTHISCTGWKDGWAQTTYDGKSGYVSAAYLLFDGKVSANGGLRLRSGPGETYDKLLTVPDGTPLTFTAQEDGWLKTTYDGKTGYVSQDYIAISATVVAGPGLNLRETAGEDGSKLTTIPNGAAVQCVGNRSGDWVKVQYNGYEGYVSAQYLSFG